MSWGCMQWRVELYSHIEEQSFGPGQLNDQQFSSAMS